MSAQPADHPVEDASLDAEVLGLVDDLREEYGSDEAALRGLARSYIILLADADRSTSLGYLRGRFSAGARPRAVDDEP